MIKKTFIGFIFAAFLAFNPVLANENQNTVDLFTSPTCPHCSDAKVFLKNFQEENGIVLDINEYEFSKNIEKIESYYSHYSVPQAHRGFVPAIFINDKYFIGFDSQVEKELSSYLLGQDWVKEKTGPAVKVPFFGEIDLKDFSLPALAVILGTIDGFNVCSLGALVMILGMVMILRSRKKIFLLGSAFVLTTAFVYGLLVFAWHQFFSFVSPYIRSMEVLIGLMALAGGIYFLKEFYKSWKSGPVCSSNNLISRISPKIEKIFEKKAGYFAMLGAVIFFAAAATVIEFPCSAFLPVLFTGILVEAGTPLNLSILYIGIYLLFYLLDEIAIFIIASFTLQIKIFSSRLIIFFNLIASLIFIFLGLYYLFGKYF